MKKSDRFLGMNRPITRRNFIHGAGLASIVGSLPTAALSGCTESSLPHPERVPGYYPPILTGLRGSHPGSFEDAHKVGRYGQQFPAGRDTGDAPYDLIVVGAGISGLAAASFYRKIHGEKARILILDNHDDFGGHAKRNEFQQGPGVRLAWGGAVNLEYPGYSKEAMGLLDELGVSIPELAKGMKFNFGEPGGLQRSVYFDADTYGQDVVVKGLSLATDDPAAVAARVDEFPVSVAARDALKKFLTSSEDLLAPMSREERLLYLHKTSYWDFLIQKAGLPEEAAQIFLQSVQGYWALLADALGADVSMNMGLPGAHVIGNVREEILSHGTDESVMFPDGNASVARLLVRSLIPAVAPGNDMYDVVMAPFDYARLDVEDSPVRLRLQSTAVNVRNQSGGVVVDYVRGDEVYRVHAGNCVLACYNMLIPHICPELPAAQKEALGYLVKHPLMVSNVLLRDAEAANTIGVSHAYCPGRLHAECWLVGGIELGGYQPEWDPSEPTVMQFYGSIGDPLKGLSGREQNRAGRRAMELLTFEDYERELRTTLAGLFAEGGFDPARDIEAITVNRWPHGYAYEYLGMFDPQWEPGQAPHEIGRKRVGRIAIANSDAGVRAYLDSAIDQAWRAVNELEGRST